MKTQNEMKLSSPGGEITTKLETQSAIECGLCDCAPVVKPCGPELEPDASCDGAKETACADLCHGVVVQADAGEGNTCCPGEGDDRGHGADVGRGGKVPSRVDREAVGGQDDVHCVECDRGRVCARHAARSMC
jgi:hypothetical protein